jgi:hypothetical protein
MVTGYGKEEECLILDGTEFFLLPPSPKACNKGYVPEDERTRV